MLLGELAVTTPVSLMLPADATEQTWLAVGHALAQRDSTTSWWWGDWWLADRPEWGDRAAFFEDPTWNGPAYSTIRHCMATCRWFEIGRRRPELTFSHHAELARHMFPRAKCEKLLDWCVAGPRPASVRQTTGGDRAAAQRAGAAGGSGARARTAQGRPAQPRDSQGHRRGGRGARRCGGHGAPAPQGRGVRAGRVG
jgi:hypothetical protein